MPGCSSASEKKTPETLYLTVEQVREAANTYLAARSLPPSARRARYQQAADLIAYHQHRNQQSRRAHYHDTLRQLRQRGINISQLKSCVPHNSYDYVAL